MIALTLVDRFIGFTALVIVYAMVLVLTVGFWALLLGIAWKLLWKVAA